MADSRPVPITTREKLHLIYLVIFHPHCASSLQKVVEEWRRKRLDERRPGGSDLSDRARLLGKGLRQSLVAILSALFLGGVIWYVVNLIGWNVSHVVARGLQVVGSVLLLWGTLFVRGWEIQTISGQSVVELVNRWIFVAVYWLGTFIAVLGVLWG